MTTQTTPPPRRSNFRSFFLRGLGILLPTILTLYILVAVYGFVDQRIAAPINAGIKRVWLGVSPWPVAHRAELEAAKESMSPVERFQWEAAGSSEQALIPRARQMALERAWARVSVGGWSVLNLIGLVVAAALIYGVGLLVGGYLGEQLLRRGEAFFSRLPLVKAVYPSVKQVTDFLVSGGGAQEKKMRFSRVVAVEYPRKGCWSLGLVTGEPLRTIRDHAGESCLTVFLPSTPPFTGWVVTVPATDTLEMPMSIDEALRFLVTGGVIVPPSQQLQAAPAEPVALAATRDPGQDASTA